MYGLILLALVIVGGVLTAMGLRARARMRRGQLEHDYASGSFRWAALVKFRRDRQFNGADGQLVRTADGTTHWLPFPSAQRRGAKPAQWAPGSAVVLVGDARRDITGIRYRTGSLVIDGVAHPLAVVASVGNLDSRP